MSLLNDLLAQDTIERLGWMLVHFLWQATVVALLLAVSLRLLRRAGASLRYVVSCAALALMVALPLITMQRVEVSGPVAEAGPPPTISPSIGMVPAQVIEMVDEVPTVADVIPLEKADLATGISWRENLAAGFEWALPYAVLGWLIGVFGLSAWHLGGWAQLQRLKRRMVREPSPPLQDRLRDLTARLGLRRAVGLLESALVEVPTVVGWLRPVILLPASALTGLSAEQLEAILAHELAHIRRYDYLVNLAQTVVEILGFYHPAVWWISRRIRIERENCCDDLAVRLCGSSLQYARALTTLEEIRHSRTELAVAANGGSLLTRIARLLCLPAEDDRRFAWLPGLVALLLVAAILIPAALVLATPEAPPAANRVDSEPNDSDQAHDILSVETTSPAQSGQEQEDPAQVLINFLIFRKISSDKIVDRETRLLIRKIMAAESPQVSYETTSGDLRPKATLGEILRTWVAGRHLSPRTTEVLIDVLQSRGYLGGEATPEVLTNNDKQAQIKIITEEWVAPADDPNTPLQRIELGIMVRATPHVPHPAGEYMRLEIGVEVTDWAPQMQPGGPPVVRTTEIASTVTARNDRYFSLLAEQSNGQDAQGEGREAMLIMVKPRIVERAHRPAGGSAADDRRRQVLLEIRTVAMDPRHPMALGMQWSAPTRVGAPTAGLQIGYTPERTFTDALLAALRRLQEQNQAEILSNQQFVATDGCQSRIKAITQEWLSQAGLTKIDSGTVLSVTPHVDDNDITLEIAFELSDSVPAGGGSDLPIVTRRAATSTITLRNSGTATFAGLTENPNAQSSREVAIFVTAKVIPEADGTARTKQTGAALPSVSKPGRSMVTSQSSITATFEGVELRLVLQELSSLAGVPIIPDPNVTGKIHATIQDVPLERALEIVLAGTPYLFKKTPDYYLVAVSRKRTDERRMEPEGKFETLTRDPD